MKTLLESHKYALDGPELFLRNWPKGISLDLRLLTWLGVVAVEHLGEGAFALRLEGRHRAGQAVFFLVLHLLGQGVELEVGEEARGEFWAFLTLPPEALKRVLAPRPGLPS
ncbi:hypothetical protein [Thermus brockianus]